MLYFQSNGKKIPQNAPRFPSSKEKEKKGTRLILKMEKKDQNRHSN